mgnify:CR=1 FL=1|tara:strand:+ start:1675 stop:2358 length:684 start_codon:yes stop_codon:yes gene_type:complete
MEDQISSKIKNMVSSELSKYPETRKNIKNYLSEKETEEKRNNPEDYLKDSNDMKQIYLLAKNKKLSVNKIREKMKDYLKDPEELKSFLKSILDSKGKKSENKEATGSGSAGGFEAPLFSDIKKTETKEATSSASSGSYETNKIWAKSMGGKHWRNAKANYMPGAKRVQVKKKCKKFPYCNQGDIGALNIFENEMLNKIIKTISTRYDLHEDFIKEIISKEINKTTYK